jgi:hypothetical protein
MMNINNAVLVGCSLGAAVIWSFHELFGLNACGRVIGACFVDQAPLQNRIEGWSLGSKGIYDDESLNRLRKEMREDASAAADGTIACCLSKPLAPELIALLKAETLRCNVEALAQLMYDHTAQDWRATLPTIDVPCLNLYGELSGCFPQANTHCPHRAHYRAMHSRRRLAFDASVSCALMLRAHRRPGLRRSRGSSRAAPRAASTAATTGSTSRSRPASPRPSPPSPPAYNRRLRRRHVTAEDAPPPVAGRPDTL